MKLDITMVKCSDPLTTRLAAKAAAILTKRVENDSSDPEKGVFTIAVETMAGWQTAQFHFGLENPHEALKRERRYLTEHALMANNDLPAGLNNLSGYRIFNIPASGSQGRVVFSFSTNSHATRGGQTPDCECGGFHTAHVFCYFVELEGG